MRCARARRLLLDRELGHVDPTLGAVLERHLETCPGCARESRLDMLVVADLALLRGEPTFELDVSDRVMTRVRELETVGRAEVPVWQLGWSTAAAVLTAVALVGGLWVMLPDLLHGARQLLAVAGSFRNAAMALTAPLIGLLEVPLRLLWSLAGALRAGSPLLNGLQPVGVGLGVLAFLVMTTTIGYVVGRDLLPVLRPSTRGGVGSGHAD